ncbi:MAG: hypothetical protein ACLVJ6_08065 [Merdibacter sp.]
MPAPLGGPSEILVHSDDGDARVRDQLLIEILSRAYKYSRSSSINMTSMMRTWDLLYPRWQMPHLDRTKYLRHCCDVAKLFLLFLQLTALFTAVVMRL